MYVSCAVESLKSQHSPGVSFSLTHICVMWLNIMFPYYYYYGIVGLPLLLMLISEIILDVYRI